MEVQDRGWIVTEDTASNRVHLTPEENARFIELSGQLLDIPYCPWGPQYAHEDPSDESIITGPGPQQVFLLDFSREALYGGAVGGGKSIALLMSASQGLNIPGYDALLLRKTFMDLGRPGALMDIAEQWWRGKPGIKFDQQKHIYTFDVIGRTRGGNSIDGHSRIEFGGLDTVNDRLKYQGGRYHFVGFDELTQFLMSDYTYLFSRIRRAKLGAIGRMPVRMRTTSNPGGPGHEWVYKRFIAQWDAWKKGLGPQPKRNFHPATLDDNYALDRDEYKEGLMELDPVTREQLMRGDWNIRPDGRVFKRGWFHVIRRDELPGTLTWARGWDMAATDPEPGLDPDWTAGALVGVDRKMGRYYIADMRHWRADPGDNDAGCEATADHDTRRVQQVMEQEPGASGKIAIRHFRIGPFRRSRFRGVPSSGKARGRTTTVKAGRKTSTGKIIAAGPLASKANAGDVYIVVDGSYDHEAMLDELDIFPDGEHDDQVDTLALAVNVLDGKVKGDANPADANGEELEMENGWRPEAMQQLAPDLGSARRGVVPRDAMDRTRRGNGDGKQRFEPDRIKQEGKMQRQVEQIWGM